MIVRGVDLNWYDLNRFMLEMHESEFMLEMRARKESGGSKSSMGRLDCSLLYAVVRCLAPRICVESGGNTGMSSTFILKGMQDAGVADGILYSVECAEEIELGALIPEELRMGYRPVRATTQDALRDGALPGAMDFFLHDSLHRRGFMLAEFREFWSRIAPGGVLVSHDVNRNSAFSEFVTETYRHTAEGVAAEETEHAFWGRTANLGFAVKSAPGSRQAG